MTQARSRDLYSRTEELDEPTLRGIADVLELRGRHPQQVAIRAAYLDLVPAWTVLCHVPGREQVLRELRRVVRPGGHLLLMDGDYASNQLAHPDRALTERIVAAWRGQVVDDPWLARRLGPLLADAGLVVEEVRGHVHVELGRVDEQTSFIWQWSLFALRQALAAGAVTEDEGERWLADLRALHASGGLFGSVNYVSVLARRP